MDVKAKARYIRMSPRKVRLVVDVVRGMKASAAQQQLKFMNKAAARPVYKLLNSAIANATNNNKLKVEDLFIKAIAVDQGPTIHRFTPRAMGRATAIRKRTSHISILLSDGKEVKQEKTKPVTKVEKKEALVKTIEKTAEKKAVEKKSPAKKSAEKKSVSKSTKKTS